MKDYAVLKTFTKYGSQGTIVICVIAVLITLAFLYYGFISWPIAVSACAIIAIGGFLLLVMVDLTRVIQDMLMPQ